MLRQTHTIIETNVSMVQQRRIAEQLDGMYTKVGFPSGKTSANGEASMEDLANRAYRFHRGIKTKSGVKSWDFMGSTFREQEKKIGGILKREYKKIIYEKTTPEKSLSRVGEYMVRKTVDKIKAITSPALEKSTVKAKLGSEKPMIDSGQMWQSVTHKEGKK